METLPGLLKGPYLLCETAADYLTKYTALYLRGFLLAALFWVLRNKARTMQWRKEQ